MSTPEILEALSDEALADTLASIDAVIRDEHEMLDRYETERRVPVAREQQRRQQSDGSRWGHF